MEKFNREIRRFFNGLYPGESPVLVFGEGNVSARTVLIGEAPGEQEVLQGRPFVGKAGKNLDELLRLAGMCRQEIYITNTVKIRPTRVSEAGNIVNRPPSREEIELFLPWLKKELLLIRPDRIVTLGNVPLKALLGSGAVIGKMHGQYARWEDIPVYPLYHPASLIYNPSLRPVYEEDVTRLGEEIHSPKGAKNLPALASDPS